MVNSALAKRINIICLLVTVIAVLILPLKKEIWYDETVSILCSKGITHDTPALLQGQPNINSSAIEALNTQRNVFNATVVDNANGFLYNTGLHWFTLAFGNHLRTYTLFSQLCGIAALIAFYFLCSLVLGDSLFTSLALLLLATDTDFMGMSHEVRSYAMGILWVILAAMNFYKFTFKEEKPLYLFLTGLFSVAAVLSHFLTAYIIIVFLAAMIVTKKSRLFTVKNLLAMAIPICLIGLFFWFSLSGFETMNIQNKQIQQRTSGEDFNLPLVFFRSMKFTAINFRMVFPSFAGRAPVILLSFIFVLLILVAGIRRAESSEEKRNLYLFFALGLSSTLFLGFLSVKSHHYTALYYRYYSFCLPFSCLFTAYVLYIFFKAGAINQLMKVSILIIIVIPAFGLFFLTIRRYKPVVKYNHAAIAREIVNSNVKKMEVPEWHAALLVQCFLPKDYKIDYVLNPTLPNFTLFKDNGVETVPVIKNNL
jgi:hypothetical protein